MKTFSPVHMVDYASQPNIQFRCDKTWDTPAWGSVELRARNYGLPEGVFRANSGRNYTFEEDKITCEKCQKNPEPPMAA